MSRTTTAPRAARTRTRTTKRKRDAYRDAAQAARAAQRKLAELAPKGPGPYAVLLAIVAEISLYSRLNDELGVNRLAEVTGMDRRTVQRALDYLARHGVIERIVPPTEEGKRTPRAWIGLPWPPMTTTPETPAGVPVDNPGEGGAPDTHMGGAAATPPRSTPEKKEVSVRSSDALRRAREAGRAGARPHAPGLVSLTSITAWAPSTPKPDPAREAERQELAAEIERRRRQREATS